MKRNYERAFSAIGVLGSVLGIIASVYNNSLAGVIGCSVVAVYCAISMTRA